MARRSSLLLPFLLAACSGSPPPQNVLDAARPDADAAAVADVTDAPDVADSPAPDGCWRLPTTGRAPSFQRLSAPVEVVRDALGIPHLYGANDDDVMYAAGYAQAVDRLFQMDLMRRSARGTLAAVLGRDKLSQDRLVRLMEIPRWGHESGERGLYVSDMMGLGFNPVTKSPASP